MYAYSCTYMYVCIGIYLFTVICIINVNLINEYIFTPSYLLKYVSLHGICHHRIYFYDLFSCVIC